MRQGVATGGLAVERGQLSDVAVADLSAGDPEVLLPGGWPRRERIGGGGSKDVRGVLKSKDAVGIGSAMASRFVRTAVALEVLGHDAIDEELCRDDAPVRDSDVFAGVDDFTPETGDQEQGEGTHSPARRRTPATPFAPPRSRHASMVTQPAGQFAGAADPKRAAVSASVRRRRRLAKRVIST